MESSGKAQRMAFRSDFITLIINILSFEIILNHPEKNFRSVRLEPYFEQRTRIIFFIFGYA